MTMMRINNKEYILKYNFKALAEIQERGIEFTAEHEFKLKDIATIFFIGLKKFHEDLNLEDAYDLIDIFLEENNLEDLMRYIQEALEKSLGKKK